MGYALLFCQAGDVAGEELVQKYEALGVPCCMSSHLGLQPLKAADVDREAHLSSFAPEPLARESCAGARARSQHLLLQAWVPSLCLAALEALCTS